MHDFENLDFQNQPFCVGGPQNWLFASINRIIPASTPKYQIEDDAAGDEDGDDSYDADDDAHGGDDAAHDGDEDDDDDDDDMMMTAIRTTTTLTLFLIFCFKMFFAGRTTSEIDTCTQTDSTLQTGRCNRRCVPHHDR